MLIKSRTINALLSALLISQPLFTNVTVYAANCCQQANAKQSIELPETAIQELQIDAGFGWGIFSGSIYNGNKDYHITQVTISMTPIHGHGHHHTEQEHQDTLYQARTYTIDTDIPPATKGALSMPLPNDLLHIHAFDWKIIKLNGYRTH
ncbi:hypothetical protein W03_02530 [Nitrosomonas sp. PY1]|uniref:hypothetical protein n=1 Tax=Nitrosomonas sp. PY1 TaxID=1803906 RepID=UPI001FC7C297|nr:hypothetical protein [Nitrosomonas sp. PY1]GKS68249.1 hypothetical protein W03_02530 [Nitrosomonas sp. PY1]